MSHFYLLRCEIASCRLRRQVHGSLRTTWPYYLACLRGMRRKWKLWQQVGLTILVVVDRAQVTLCRPMRELARECLKRLHRPLRRTFLHLTLSFYCSQSNSFLISLTSLIFYLPIWHSNFSHLCECAIRLEFMSFLVITCLATTRVLLSFLLRGLSESRSRAYIS
jgi:hypothetical protein